MASDNADRTRASDWVCALKKENSEDETAVGVGFIVKFSNRSVLPSLPGLSNRTDGPVKITTSYALVTCHHTIASLNHLDDWNLYCPGIPQRESCLVPLKDIASDCVTCCGEKCGFICSGKSSVHAHPENSDCDLKLNFTILFLNEHFEQCILGYVGGAAIPTVDIPQGDVKLRHCQEALFGPDTRVVCEQFRGDDSHSAPQDTSCLQLLCPRISNNEVSINAIPIEIFKPKPLESSQPSQSIRNDISEFQKVCTVSFRISPNHDCSFCPGSPIVYSNPITSNVETIAVHTGLLSPGPLGCDGETPTYGCVTIYGMIQLLQGGLIPTFAILRVPQAHRLWPHRWSHLLRPFNAQCVQRMGPEALLETLVLLMEKVGGGRLIVLSARDPPEARISTLQLLADVFSNFQSFKEEDVQLARQRFITPSEEFDRIIRGLCNALIGLLSSICGDRDPVEGQIEACLRCYRALLYFKHKDIIEILGDQKSLQYTEDLKDKEKTVPVLDLLASIHKECSAINKGLLKAEKEQHLVTKSAMQEENRDLLRDNQHLEQQLADARAKIERLQSESANLEFMLQIQKENHQKLNKEVCQLRRSHSDKSRNRTSASESEATGGRLQSHSPASNTKSITDSGSRSSKIPRRINTTAPGSSASGRLKRENSDSKPTKPPLNKSASAPHMGEKRE